VPAEARPIIPLLDYQKSDIESPSRFSWCCWSRQIGKSFTKSLRRLLRGLERRRTQILLSAGERQSRELMLKVQQHCRALNVAAQFSGQGSLGGTRFSHLLVTLPNGVRIIGLPANPATARGFTGDAFLDEFALHKDSREIWKALFPTVTRGYKIRIISTFKGKSNKFYELFYSAPTLQRFTGPQHEYVGERGGWSKHLYSIADAVKMGLELHDEEGKPIEPDDLRLALNDDDAWDEEFMCIPSDEVSAFITHEMISAVESPTLVKEPAWVGLILAGAWDAYGRYKATQMQPPTMRLDVLDNVDFLGDLYAGLDIGRRKDLSVLWLDQKIGEVLSCVAVIDMLRMPYFVQECVLHTILGHRRTRRACIDQTGIGSQLAERAIEMYGGKVEGIDFTAGNKETLAVGLKNNFDDRRSAVPADATIRASLHSVKKFQTATKHFRFDAERTDATGHADHFWAKALSVQAASVPYSKPEYESVERRSVAGIRGAYG